VPCYTFRAASTLRHEEAIASSLYDWFFYVIVLHVVSPDMELGHIL